MDFLIKKQLIEQLNTEISCNAKQQLAEQKRVEYITSTNALKINQSLKMQKNKKQEKTAQEKETEQLQKVIEAYSQGKISFLHN